MSLANLQGKLTRKEMKNISGGSGAWSLSTQNKASSGGFLGELVKTIGIDVICNNGIKPLATAVANDWNSRSGGSATQTERYATNGPY